MLKLSRLSAMALILFSSFAVVGFNAIQSKSTVSADTTTLADRVKSYEKLQGKKLSKGEQELLILHCIVAQAKIKVLQSRVADIKANRATAYQNMTDQLDKLTKKLDDQEYETTQLKKLIATLKPKLDDYTSQMNDYKQAIDDSIALDCRVDPVAFSAALFVARNSHDKLVITTPDIRNYILNTVEQYLDQIGKQLDSGQTTGGSQ